MKVYLIRSLIIVLSLLAVMTPGAALAHGEPVIAVNPVVVAAGGEITVTGSDMEAGEVFALTLEGPTGSSPLGQAPVTGEGEEGGFTISLTIPAETLPGFYLVRAATAEGEATTAELTVTAPTVETEAGPATIQEPTGEPHLLERAKPAGQIVAVAVLIALSAAAGFFLVRSRG